MRVHIIGCGDAFGSGGRHQTCFHVTGPGLDMLVDCGATAYRGLAASGIALDRLQAVLITHFHADHFGALPFFFLACQYKLKRAAPLVIAGPPQIRAKVEALLAISYPGHGTTDLPFPVSFVEIAPGETRDLPGARVTAFEMQHDPRSGVCNGYRIEAGGKVFAFSGDTRWTEQILPLGRDADFFLLECYTRATKLDVHLDYATLKPRIPEIGARRLMLTHMSADMLDHRHEIAEEMASDGLTIDV